MRFPAPSVVAILAVALAPVRGEAQTERASVASSGAEADAPSSRPAVSGDGRIVVFASDATNLVPSDLNGTTDVFVRDRAARTTVRISVDPSGGEGNGASAEPAISRDGRFVVFSSLATSLVPGDTNGSSDVFLHDRVLGRTTRVSTDSNGAQADGPCFDPTISSDGLFVAFVSGATNLAGGAGAQGGVFLKDLTTGSTTLVVGGIFFLSTWVRPSVSDGGGLVAATHVDIGPVFTFAALFDVRNGTLIPVDVSPSGQPGDGQSGGIRVSADGSLAVFQSDSSNLVPQGTTFFRSQVYARDLRLGVTTLLSAGTDGSEGSDISYAPAISVDGTTVAFESWAANLVAGDANGTPDVFVRRLAAGETVRASVGSSGSEAAGTSSEAAVSADGRYAVFTSDAPDLVAGDANATIDVFVRDLGTIGLDSVAPASGSEAGGDVANLFGSEFTTRADTSVAIGGAPATVLYVASGVIVVRTPPGSGRADVEIRNSNGRAVLAAAYEYLDPALAARLGSVNARFGEREDVLFVNASAGDARRELVVAVGAPVDVAMRAPSTRPSARFALYARLGAPGPAPVAQPFGLGFAVFPTPLNAGAPPPAAIWNNVIGAGASRLGAPDRPSSPAPTTVLRRNAGSSRAVDLTLQGFVRDGGSPNRHELSPTNAIVVRFR